MTPENKAIVKLLTDRIRKMREVYTSQPGGDKEEIWLGHAFHLMEVRQILEGQYTTGTYDDFGAPEGKRSCDARPPSDEMRGNEMKETMTEGVLRATVVAHAIRLGKRPSVGTEIGFSAQLKQGEMDEVVSATGAVDISKTTPVSEKEWAHFIVTQADIDAAHALINAQKITYREAGGKVSQMLTEE